MMKRVVVTGMGIVSCLGNDRESVLDALRQGKSGIRFKEEYQQRGMRSCVAGWPDIDLDAFIDRKSRRFMGDAAAYAYIAMQQAIADAGLPNDLVSNERTGLIAGSGGASSSNQVDAADIAREKGVKRVGPHMATRTMASTVSACLATPFQIKGVNYSIGSACATSAHCIGNAMEIIQLGKQDMIFAGGGEEEHDRRSRVRRPDRRHRQARRRHAPHSRRPRGPDVRGRGGRPSVGRLRTSSPRRRLSRRESTTPTAHWRGRGTPSPPGLPQPG